MNRWWSVSVAAVAVASLGASLAGCNNVACGPGTKQVQQANGKLQCVPVDVPTEGSIPCDADGGATIVGGSCVSALKCGSGTKQVGNQCIGSGGGGPPTCATPAPNRACISGSLLNFLDNSASTDTVHVALYDPTSLLQGGPPIAEQDTSGGYVFQDFQPPQLMLIAVVVTNPMGVTTFTTSATGDQNVVAGNIYQVDAYVIPKTVTDGWKPAIDVTATGAYVGKFYNDPKPPNTLLKANEKNPVAGVQLTKNGSTAAAVDPTAKYFDTSLATISATATSTTAVGAAIIPSPDLSAGFPSFSGFGPSAMPIAWESQPGGSAAGLVFVTRFHPNM